MGAKLMLSGGLDVGPCRSMPVAQKTEKRDAVLVLPGSGV